jgi:hypothetical protein
LPEARARTTSDAAPSRRTAKAEGRGRDPLPGLVARNTGRFLIGQLVARPATTIAGAAFAALMTGIVLNALLLQNTRHPAPLFTAAPPKAEAAPPRARLAVTAVPTVPAPAPPQAVEPPPESTATIPPTSKDTIAQMLNNGGTTAGPPEPSRKAAIIRAPKDPIAQVMKGGGEGGKSAEVRRKSGERTHTKDLIGQFLRTASVPAPDKPVRR